MTITHMFKKHEIKFATLTAAIVCSSFNFCLAKGTDTFDAIAYIKHNESEFGRISATNKPTFEKTIPDPDDFENKLSQLSSSKIPNKEILSAYGTLCMVYTYKGNFEKADKIRTELVKRWTETEPGSLDDLHGLQLIYSTNCIAAKRFGEVEPVLKQAIEDSNQKYCKDPTHRWTASIGMAIVKLEAGKKEEASELSKKCKQMEDEYNKTLKNAKSNN